MKAIKDALNKIPDKNLDKFFITHQMWLDDPEPKFGLVFMDDEENHTELFDMYDKPGMDVLSGFVEQLNRDCVKIACAKLDEDLIDSIYQEDFPG